MTFCVSCGLARPVFFGDGVAVASLFPVRAATAGWMVVFPIEHVVDPRDLHPDVRAELADVLFETDRRMRERWHCSRVYAASIGTGAREHIHWHVVPQWGNELKGAAVLGGDYTPPRWLTVQEAEGLFDE